MNIYKELFDGYSVQAKTVNRYWLILITISIISIVEPNPTNTEKVLPLLNFGSVNYKEFISIISLMLYAIAIAYASAFLQMQITRKLFQKVIDNAPEKDKYISNVHIQDIFDSVVTPTFNRVAPISQFLQGNNQFFGESTPNRFSRYFGVILYVFLKIISGIIIFIIPLYALIKNFELLVTFKNQNLLLVPVSVYWVICSATMGIFVILIISDIRYIVKASRRIVSKNIGSNVQN